MRGYRNNGVGFHPYGAAQHCRYRQIVPRGLPRGGFVCRGAGNHRVLKCKDFLALFNQIVKILLGSSFVVTFLHTVKVH